MNTRDFERAIDMLCVDVVIDEIKLKHSAVRQVNAHTHDKLLVWDEHGRAFSACKKSKRQMFFTEDENGNFLEQSGISVKRDNTFDLKFENYVHRQR